MPIGEICKTITDMVQKSLKTWIFVFLVCLVLEFSPSPMLEKLSLKNFINDYSAWIGFVFIFSLCAICVLVFEKVLNFVLRLWKIKRLEKQLHDLTVEQKQVLCQYIFQETTTQYFSIEDGVVNGLVIMGVLYKSAEVGRLDSWAFNIQIWAQKYLNDNPNLITDGVPRYEGELTPYRGPDREGLE